MSDPWFAALVRPRTAWLAALIPLLAGIAAIVLLGEATRTPSPVDALPRDVGSTVAASLGQRLPDDAAPAVVLFTADRGELGPESLPALQEVVDRVRRSLSIPGGPPVTPSED